MISKIFNRKLYCALLSGLLSASCINAMEDNSFSSQCVTENQDIISDKIKYLVKEIRKNDETLSCILKEIGFVQEENHPKGKTIIVTNDIKVFDQIRKWIDNNQQLPKNHWALEEAKFLCNDYFLKVGPFSSDTELEDLQDVLNLMSNALIYVNKIKGLVKEISKNDERLYCMLKEIGFVNEEEQPFFVSNNIRVFIKIRNWIDNNKRLPKNHWALEEAKFLCNDYFLKVGPFSSDTELGDLKDVLNLVSEALKHNISKPCTCENKIPSKNKVPSSNTSYKVISKHVSLDRLRSSLKSHELWYSGFQVFSTKSYAKHKKSHEMLNKMAREFQADC